MYRKEKRIPTLFALLLIIFGMGGSVLLDQNVQSLMPAKASSPPEEVHFSNISDNSISVSWTSSLPVLGSVTVNNGKTVLSYLDDLDNDTVPRTRNTHYVTIKNLTEDSSYKIRVISGNSNCGVKENCLEFNQQTGQKLPSTLSLPPVRGSVITEEGKPAAQAIVYIIVGNSIPLSGRVDSAGIFAVPLMNLRTTDLTKRPTLSDNDLIQITIKYSSSQTATAVIDIKSIRENQIIPEMTLGNSYNFINLLSKKDLLAKAGTANILGIQSSIQSTGNQNGKTKIDLIFPKQNQDTTIDNSPRIRGTGIPGKDILITLHSSPQLGKVTVTADGTWDWRPPKPLEPGIHTISIQAYDTYGRPVTINRQFVVLKSGERVLGDATSSATLTPTIPVIPTDTPVPTETPAPTVIPTITTAVLPTVTPYILPTATTVPVYYSPTPATRITNPPEVPPRSGAVTPLLLLIGGGVSLIVGGIKLISIL